MQDKNGTPIHGGDRVRVTMTFEARVYDWFGVRDTWGAALPPEAPIQVIPLPRRGFLPTFGLFPVNVASADVEKLP